MRQRLLLELTQNIPYFGTDYYDDVIEEIKRLKEILNQNKDANLKHIVNN